MKKFNGTRYNSIWDSSTWLIGQQLSVNPEIQA